jgi:hypothetical protein
MFSEGREGEGRGGERGEGTHLELMNVNVEAGVRGGDRHFLSHQVNDREWDVVGMRIEGHLYGQAGCFTDASPPEPRNCKGIGQVFGVSVARGAYVEVRWGVMGGWVGWEDGE